MERAFAQGPMPDAWANVIVPLLIKQGVRADLIRNAIERAEWEPVPLLDQDVLALSCRSCGAKPVRGRGGRILLGCNGNCQQRAFADLVDDARVHRLREAAATPAGDVTSSHPTPVRTLWDDE